MPLVKELREAGYSVWLDDTNIESAALWAEQIVEGLKNCKVLMLMASKDSLASANVLKEVMLASELEKTLLPVYLEECELPSRFQYQLAGIQHIELFEPSDQQPIKLLSNALDKTGANKSEDGALSTDDDSLPESGHKFILSKSKYIISSLIGYLTILVTGLGGFSMAGGSIWITIHFAEVVQVVGITFGALFFSYRSSAFKPWLVPLGLYVPEEEEIIKKYIQICDSATYYAIAASILSTLLGFINTAQYMTSDMMMVAAMVAAALSAITFALGVLLLIVIPTKFKLQSLLSDRKVFEAEQRERQKLLDQLKKDWAKDFNRSDGLDNDAKIESLEINANRRKIGLIKSIRLWILNSPSPITRILSVIVSLILGFYLIAGIAVVIIYQLQPESIQSHEHGTEMTLEEKISREQEILIKRPIDETITITGNEITVNMETNRNLLLTAQPVFVLNVAKEHFGNEDTFKRNFHELFPEQFIEGYFRKYLSEIKQDDLFLIDHHEGILKSNLNDRINKMLIEDSKNWNHMKEAKYHYTFHVLQQELYELNPQQEPIKQIQLSNYHVSSAGIRDHLKGNTGNGYDTEFSAIIIKGGEVNKYRTIAKVLTNMTPADAAISLRAESDAKECAKMFYFIQTPDQNALISELNSGTKIDRILAADILKALTKIESVSGEGNTQ